MNIETLQYFHYIAKYKNITHAARQLFVSQSTLSRHIMALENELGVKLFERSNKHIDLTEAGNALYKNSGALISHMEAVIEEVKAADKGHSGVLRITLPSQLHYILTEPLAVLRREFPNVHVILESYFFDEIKSAVEHDLYGAGFTYDFAFLDDENIESIPVETEHFCLVAPSACVPEGYTEEQKQAVIAEVVTALPLTLPSHVEPPFIKKILSTFQDYANAKVISTNYVNTTESALLNISLGLCYSIIPSSWAKSHSIWGDVTFLDLPELPAECTVVMLRKRSNNCELVNYFANVVKASSQGKLSE